jgi:hypothetical protein
VYAIFTKHIVYLQGYGKAVYPLLISRSGAGLLPMTPNLARKNTVRPSFLIDAKLLRFLIVGVMKNSGTSSGVLSPCAFT